LGSGKLERLGRLLVDRMVEVGEGEIPMFSSSS
jgi:hypothetical protein